MGEINDRNSRLGDKRIKLVIYYLILYHYIK